jgi:catechol 2,3-dioxygenase
MPHSSWPNLVDRLRAVTLGVTDLERSLSFYTGVWGLEEVQRNADSVFLRAAGTNHHVLVLTQSPAASLISVTLGAFGRPELLQLYERLVQAGVHTEKPPRELPGAAGGWGFAFHDGEGRVFKVVADRADHAAAQPSATRPVKLAHVVFNAVDADASSGLLTQTAGFRLSDQTAKMRFLRCNSDHHSVAFCQAGNTSLNHIAFQMASWNELMFGVGRMKLAGYKVQWGVGRHGPGDNVFAYFLDPDGFAIEYTAEMQQIDEATHRAGQPADWVRPPERMDQWAHADLPSEALKQAMHGDHQNTSSGVSA